jgi:transcriptional regulator of heat shock response
VRTLLARVEEPAPQANSEPLFVMIEDALAAVSARLSLGTGGGCMMLLGPVRMRYPQALMVARGVAEAVSHSLSHDPNEAKQP